MKRFVVLACAVLLVLGFTGIASAYYFEDTIDDWGPLGDAVPIVEGIPFVYQHDLNDDVNFAAGHTVTEVWLELDFTNDLGDGNVWVPFLGSVNFDEHASVAFDGSAWQYIDEVDNGQYDIVVDIDFINDDGYLDIQLAVWNPPNGFATAWLDHSKVYGSAVPEPGTILLLGVGMLGLVGLGRKKFKK